MKEDQIQIVEIAQVFVANPRPRNPVKFQAIVASIEAVGLKRPILVNQRASADGRFQYELVCGQGRLEACLALGRTTIPAIVTEVTREQLYLIQREFPRLCRGGSSSLTFTGVHPRNFER
jgi:ParB family chromosome partitioning protein